MVSQPIVRSQLLGNNHEEDCRRLVGACHAGARHARLRLPLWRWRLLCERQRQTRASADVLRTSARRLDRRLSRWIAELQPAPSWHVLASRRRTAVSVVVLKEQMTFKDFEDDLQTAFKFYELYRDGGTWLLEPSSPEPLLGLSISPRTCRFCRKKAPHANFRRQAHAVPELLGNKSLLVAYECDTCNSKFGSSYEHQLGAWTKPIRTLSRIRGKKGVPSLEKSGSFKIVDTPNGLHFTEYAESPDLELNRDAKQWIMILQRDPHVPLKVLKAFVRIVCFGLQK